MSTKVGTGKLGICVSGNLDTPHLRPETNGIDFVISVDDAPLLSELFQHLKWLSPPEITPVQLLPGEQLMDIKALIAEIKKRKDDGGDGENAKMLMPKRKEIDYSL